MITGSDYTLVEKRLIEKDGKMYYRLHFYSHKDGVVFQVFAPLIQKEIINENSLLENAR